MFSCLPKESHTADAKALCPCSQISLRTLGMRPHRAVLTLWLLCTAIYVDRISSSCGVSACCFLSPLGDQQRILRDLPPGWRTVGRPTGALRPGEQFQGSYLFREVPHCERLLTAPAPRTQTARSTPEACVDLNPLQE